jgi:glycosyltransferase involved in cell wall biosynthesis
VSSRRILLSCATPEFTGPAELMLEDAVTLRDAGHDVTLAFDTVRPGTLAARVAVLGFPVAALGLDRRSGPVAFARDAFALRRALRAGRYDLLHARFSLDHHVALAAAAGLRDRVEVIRSCELLHNVGPGLARRLAYARTDRFAVPSREHAQALERRFGVPPERVMLLPGRVDAARFSPGASRLRAELGIPAVAPLAGMVSRIKPDRLQDVLLRAFVAAGVPGAHLVFVGRGEGEAPLRELAARIAPAGTVHFAGYRTGDALVDAYRALDLQVWLAPGNDGTCRAVLEAMACGTAILGGRFGAVAEAVDDGVTGRLCDPRDPQAVSAALADLLSGRDRLVQMGAAGRARALAVYTPGNRADAVLSLVARAAEKEATWPSSTPI